MGPYCNLKALHGELIVEGCYEGEYSVLVFKGYEKRQLIY